MSRRNKVIAKIKSVPAMPPAATEAIRLLQDPDVFETVIAIVTAIVGVWFISAAMIGYLFRRLALLPRAALMLGGVLLLIPAQFHALGGYSDIIGAVIAAIVLILEYTATRVAKRAATSG